MAVSGKQRMINSINELNRNDECTEAVLLQQRPKWALAAMFGAVVVIIVLLGAADLLGGSGVLLGAIGGGIGGLLFAVVTNYWILARVGDEVQLARSSKMSAKAVEIVERHPVPVPVEIKKGLLQSKVAIGGQSFFAARQFVKRIEAAVS